MQKKKDLINVYISTDGRVRVINYLSEFDLDSEEAVEPNIIIDPPNTYATYKTDYPKEKYGDSYYRLFKGDPYLTNTKIYKKFVELVQECLEKHGYDSMHVLNNIEYNIYEDSAKFPDSDKNYFKLLSNGKITLEEFEEFFNKVMKEDYIITYYDQAYTPFVKPEIYIL